MISFFHTILYEPLFNALILIYNFIPGRDFGIAIILLTLIVRFALFPLNNKALKSQTKLTALQPKIKEIKEKYKDDRTRQSQEFMKLYAEHKVNPLGGCLPMLIQFPILIALYWVFINGLNPEKLNGFYWFVANPGAINMIFIGILDLSKPSWILALLTGLAQFYQSKLMFKNKSKAQSSPNDMANMMSSQMTYLMPIFIVFISWRLPAGLPLYWFVTTLFSVAQQYLINRKNAIT